MVRCYNKRRVEGGRGYLVPRECVKWTSAYHTVQVFFRNITISACEGDKELGSYEITSMHIAQLPEPRTVLPNSFEDFAEIANNGKIFYSFTPEYCESLEIFFTKHCIKGQLEVLLNMLHLV